ncbi:MAG: ABC transporter permease [Vicinamibacterales bacterium]
MSDIRYAIRTLLRSPGFTIVGILTLALGIGATTAIFSVVNAVLLRPLPYADPDRLVSTRGSLADLRDLEMSNQSFDGIAFWASNLYNLRRDGDTQQVVAGQVSRNLFPLLGIQPLLGRNFTVEDEQQDTVILGYGLWQRQFAGNSQVVGRTVDLSGTTYTVIGVMPPWFRFPASEFQLWAPLNMIDRQSPEQAKNRAFRIFSAVARLKPGVTVSQAQSELRSFSERLAREFPSTNEGVTYELQPLYERLVGGSKPALRLLFGTVGLLLLIACANVANLTLARATVREREMAIRAALGAGRRRLVRLLTVESLMLAAAGGLLGLIVTMWGVDVLPSVLETRLPRADGIRIDTRVLAFSACATLLTGLIFGLAPALQATKGQAVSLKDGGRSVAGSARARRVRQSIAVLQTAFAVIVLIGAGLLLRSFVKLSETDTGFTPTHLVSFNVQFISLPTTADRGQIGTALIESLAHAPGIEAAGASTGLPTVTPQRATRFAIDGRTLTAGEDTAYFIAATPGYFGALRTPVLQGRAIESSDRSGGSPVVVINRAFAAQFFPSGDALGHRVRIINPEQSTTWRTIVGVVGDVKYRGLNEDVPPTLYTPFAQTPFMWLYAMVRAPGTFESVASTLRARVPGVHPSLTPGNIRQMTDLIAQGVSGPRFNTMLVSAFAVLALLLSSIGIYGVIAYSVAQRNQEIGVRMALGAAGRDIMRLIVSEGIAIAILGVSVGLAGAFALSRVMDGLLVGISAHDPLTFAGGAIILLVVALIASYAPARRASRVQPLVALRE